MNIIPLDRKALIIEDAKASILQGDGLAEIAKRHGIAPRTLDYWMAQQPDNVELRQAWIDNKLLDAQALMDQAIEYAHSTATTITDETTGKVREIGIDVPTGTLRLRCAGEALKSAQWLAERRDSRYQAKPLVQIGINIDIGRALEDAEARAVQYLPKGESNG